MNNERISYKVIANVGTLAKYQSGWSKDTIRIPFHSANRHPYIPDKLLSEWSGSI